MHVQALLTVDTHPKTLKSITHAVQQVVTRSGIGMGLCTVFLRHTSASLIIQENADPDVLRDLEDFLARLIPENFPYRHCNEGPDDMPAHIRSALTRTSETIPIRHGQLVLGTWQGLYVWEHRDQGHARELVIHLIGES